MHTIELAILPKGALAKYRYLVGPYTIGIIPPTRRKHIVSIQTVREAWTGAEIPVDTRNGMHDRRVTPEEIANYILRTRLK